MQNVVMDGYISEADAIEKLTRIIGKKITIEDIKECATLGIIPAYAQFMPINFELYAGHSFHLVWGSDLNYDPIGNPVTPTPGSGQDSWKILPLPLPSNGQIKDTDGIAYRVLVLRSDGKLEPVTDQHYIIIYTDQELRKTAKSVKRYLSKGEINTTNHAYCQKWEVDRDHDHDLTMACMVGPFADSKNTTADESTVLKDNRERTSLHLIIAALANKAGYNVENEAQTAGLLRDDLTALGLGGELTGKGTLENHFIAIAATVHDAKEDYKKSPDRK